MHVAVTLVHATIVKLDATAQNPAITGNDEPRKNSNIGHSKAEDHLTYQFFSGTRTVIVVGTRSTATDSQLTIGI